MVGRPDWGLCLMLPVFLLLSAAAATTPVAAPPADPVRADDTDIVVTASGIAQPASQAGQAITVLTRDRIEREQTPVVSDLLALTPGVTVTRNGGPGSLTGVRIRGAESDQTLVLVDGIRVGDPSSTGGGFDFGSLLAGNVSRIEVLRGPNSVIWGSQALGGVVNVTTLDPVEGNYLRASGEYGWRDTAQVTGEAGALVGPARLSAGASWYTTDGISAFSEARGGRERDGFDQLSAHAKLLVALGPDASIDLRGWYNRGNVGIDGFPPPNYSFADTPEYSRSRQLFGYAGVNVALFDGMLKNRIAYVRGDTDRQNRDPSATPSTTFYSQGGLERFEYQGTLTPVRQATIVFGAETERSTILTASPSSFDPRPVALDDAVRLTSFYAQAILTPLEGVTLTGGVRHDHHSLFGDKTTFGANAAWAVRSGTTLRATYAEGFKAPTLYQLASDYGNRRLVPETAKSYDVGIEQAIADQVRASVTWFHRDTRNQIDFAFCAAALVTQPASICYRRPFGVYDNIARARAEGVEAGLELRPTERFTVAGQYSNVSTRNESIGSANLGKRLARRPVQTVSVSADWTTPVGLAIGGTVLHVGDSFNDAANSTRLDGYVLASLRAALPIAGRFSIYGRIENLFDERYETVATYGTPGRAAYAGVRVRLD